MRKLLALFLLAAGLCLLFVLSASAEQAEKLNCTFSSTNNKMNFRLTDGKEKKTFEGVNKKENRIEVTMPAGKPAYAVYAIFPLNTSEIALDIWNGSEWVSGMTLNRGEYVHEYTALPGVSKFRLRSLDEKGTIPIAELTVLGEGEPPADVQVWEPRCERADILFFVAHPDDEFIFFGGAIPVYAGEKKLHVAVTYMTCKEEPRLHELLNGLWTAGCHEYPYLLNYYDKLCSSTKIAYKYWGGLDAALDGVAEMIETCKPSVIVTQDIHGEYGHGAHMAVADMMLRIVRDGERTLTWPVQKLYLHLWKENQVYMDWLQPLEAFGGQTGIDVGAAAFKCHTSQQGFDTKLKNGKIFKFQVKSGGMFDNAAYGLAWSSVEPDTANDFMEHITPVGEN